MIRSINHSRKDFYLEIEGVSWKKNYQNLFDYDQRSNQYLFPFRKQVSLRQSLLLIYRNKKTLQISMHSIKQLNKINLNQISVNEQLLCGVKSIMKDKVYSLKFYQSYQILQLFQQQNQNTQKQYSEHHMVVRSLKNHQNQPVGYKLGNFSQLTLDTNNIIKLGNLQFFIHSIYFDTKQIQPLSEQQWHQTNYQQEKPIKYKNQKSNISKDQNKNKALKIQKCFDKMNFFISNNQRVYNADLQNNENQTQCKYCMMTQSNQYGEFLCSPCKCSGSCGLVHFNCLMKWNQSKVKKNQSPGCVEYNFQKFFCQVCKQEYPQYIRKKSQIYELLPIQKPTQDFMILESLHSEKRHVIIIENVNPQGLSVGRGNDCSLKLDDPTISRRHAIIKKINNNFIIFDLQSKFGTLVRDHNLTVSLKKNDKFSIQAGRTVISFSLNKKSPQFMFQS